MSTNNNSIVEKWEYKVYHHELSYDHHLWDMSVQKELNTTLNKFGAEGWELVVSGTSRGYQYGQFDIHIFKRKI